MPTDAFNPTPQVKICGLTREEDVRAADAAGASFLGFILAPSKRRISPEQAIEISQEVSAKRVAVTVNASAEELDEIMAIFAPDFIQFHGDESPEHIAKCAAHYDVGVIKACAIASDVDMKAAERFAAANFILYDAKPPKGETVRGGHGIAIDWNIIARAPLPKVWALAGGLTPDNVTEALSVTRAPILDVSSGVETAPGVKDHALLQAFMKAVSHGRS